MQNGSPPTRSVQPLSPDQFGSGAAARVTGPARPGAPVDLGDPDRATLKSVSDQIAALRADLRGSAADVRRAKRNLLAITSYLTGLMDGRGTPPAVHVTGFDTVLGSRLPPDLDSSLDDLQEMLDSLTGKAATRTVTEASSIIRVVGDVMISLGSSAVVAGAVLLVSPTP